MADKQKEMKFGVRISNHDYGYRVERIKKFLSKHDTVLLTVQFRGRELTHAELGMRLMERLLADLVAVGRSVGRPALKGRVLQCLVVPL